MAMAAQELLPVGFNSASVWNEESERGQKITSLGAIKFGEDKCLMVGADGQGVLHTKYRDFAGDTSELTGLMGDERRVKNYADCSAVIAVQVDLGAVVLDLQPTLLGGTTVTARIQYTDPLKGVERWAELDEERLAGVLKGDGGGLEAFRGGSRPEQLALEVNETFDDGSQAAVLCFFYPKDLEGSRRNSISGLREFLKNLNGQYEQNIHTDLQDRALAELKSDLQKGRMRVDGLNPSALQDGVIGELIKSRVILAARTGDSETLEKLLPGLKPSLWEKVTGVVRKLRDEKVIGVRDVKAVILPGLENGDKHKLITEDKNQIAQIEVKPAGNRSKRQEEINAALDELKITNSAYRLLRSAPPANLYLATEVEMSLYLLPYVKK